MGVLAKGCAFKCELTNRITQLETQGPLLSLTGPAAKPRAEMQMQLQMQMQVGCEKIR
jgi:hypothetical protein